MPLKRVIRPVAQVAEEVVSATCNVCGVTQDVKDPEGFPFNFQVIELTGGYGSEFPADMDTLEIVVCEDCLRAWVKTFKHPDVNLGSGMFPIPTKAVHTETGKTMTVHRYIAVEGDEVPDVAWEHNPIMEPKEDFPVDDTIWRHFKGNLYQIRGIVWEWPSLEVLVHYQGLYGDSQCFLRPLSMFMDEAREGVPRFEFVSLES